jgi:hypothetical protein
MISIAGNILRNDMSSKDFCGCYEGDQFEKAVS